MVKYWLKNQKTLSEIQQDVLVRTTSREFNIILQLTLLNPDLITSKFLDSSILEIHMDSSSSYMMLPSITFTMKSSSSCKPVGLIAFKIT